METRKILFNVDGKDYRVTVTGKKESIDHVVEALDIKQEIEQIHAERHTKDLELAAAFKNQFQKGDEEAKKYGHE